MEFPSHFSLFCLVLLISTCAALAVEGFQRCEHNYDVVVVGAGLSGLSTAYELRKAGLRTIIFEARDRVGGRVHGRRVRNGGVQEVGAEFIGPTQDRMYALAQDLGLTLFDEYTVGNNTLYYKGFRSTYDGSMPIPPVDEPSLQEVFATTAELDAMAAEIDVNAPWDHPKAKEWDSQTFSQWFRPRISTDGSQFLLKVATTSIFSVEPSDLSLLYVVAYIAAAGNATTKGTLERLISTDGGAQQTRVKGGSQLFATELAKKLGSGAVSLGSAVESIHHFKNRYRIRRADGSLACAIRVVVAMSPPLAGQIEYDPPLPDDKIQLFRGMNMAAVGKAIAIYDTPFWRLDNLTGQALSDVGAGRATFDNSPPDASYGALMSFIEGDEMRRWDHADQEDVEEQIIKDYVNYFGPRAAETRGFILQRWDLERWSQGGPVAISLPGVLAEYGGVLRDPHNGIHFAGTETSDYWVGYMEGAVRSGIRVAAEIIHDLRRLGRRI